MEKPNCSAFVLASVMGHAMIVNRFDYDDEKREAGVGRELLDMGDRGDGLGFLVCKLAHARRKARGDGVLIIDGGANIGSYAVLWARFMAGASTSPWGRVLAFEPQEWPYYALCGNLAMNNCFNASALRLALSDKQGSIDVPFWHPLTAHNFGSCSLRNGGDHAVQAVPIDKFGLDRLDILKLDLEGMEPQAIMGASQSIAKHKPIIIAEGNICGPETIIALLPDYGVVSIGPDLLCVHKDERNPDLTAAMGDLARQLNMRAA